VQVEQARLVCRACPVVAECLDWAIRHAVPSGVWGGLSEYERLALHRRRRLAAMTRRRR
jgi:WhiB family redox-sensing transcriptional regulator